MKQQPPPRPEGRVGGGVQIGTLAAQLGLNPKTIRYYEEIGLLPQPRRTQSGYRLYEATTRDQLRFITKAKQVGLSLAEIGEILALWRGNASPCAHLVEIIDDRLGEVRQELSALREEASCGPDGSGAFCRAIEHHESQAQRAHERRA